MCYNILKINRIQVDAFIFDRHHRNGTMKLEQGNNRIKDDDKYKK